MKDNISNLLHAISQENLEDLQEILFHNSRQNIDWINSPDEHGNTPLLIALLVGNLNIIKLLLDFHANLSYTSRYGDTVCHIAAANHDDIHLIQFLYQKGCNIKAKNKVMVSFVDPYLSSLDENLFISLVMQGN